MQKNIHNILFVIFWVLACTASTAQRVGADTFEQKLKDSPQAQLIDVRTAEEYAVGHLKNAQNINLRSADFEQKIQTLDKSKPVFVYCLAGARSKTAADLLAKNGFTQIVDMEGGLMQWTAKQKEIEKGQPNTAHQLPAGTLESLIAQEPLLLVDFYAEWCGPCQKMSPWISHLQQEFAGKARIQKVDADANQNLAQRYGVQELPTLLLYKKGQLVWKASGLQTEEQMRTQLTQQLK
jgi:thioredoxin 1